MLLLTLICHFPLYLHRFPRSSYHLAPISWHIIATEVFSIFYRYDNFEFPHSVLGFWKFSLLSTPFSSPLFSPPLLCLPLSLPPIPGYTEEKLEFLDLLASTTPGLCSAGDQTLLGLHAHTLPPPSPSSLSFFFLLLICCVSEVNIRVGEHMEGVSWVAWKPHPSLISYSLFFSHLAVSELIPFVKVQ